MAQSTENNKVAVKNDDTVVTYQISNGQEISLTHSAIKQLTNDNEYINEGEIELFINLCKFQKLNPFTKEAFLIKFDNSKPAQQVTALGAFMRMADEQPNYDGIEDGIIVATKDGKVIDRIGCVLYPGETLMGGWAKVYRRDRKVPTVARISLTEYSKGQSTWRQMPCVMINKCAKVGALRKAFPGTYQGLYEEDELKMSGVIDVTPTPPTDTTYDIPSDTVCEDTIVGEATTTSATANTDFEILPYAKYKEAKDLYELVPDPVTGEAYDKTTGKIRVRRK